MGSYYIQMADDYLEHHGIEGQKWGVKNGPPYPLDAGDRSPREVRAALRKKNRAQDNDALRVSKNLSNADILSLAKQKTVESYQKALDDSVSGLKKMFPREFKDYKDKYGLSDAEVEKYVKRAVAARVNMKDSVSGATLWAAFGVFSIPISMATGEYDRAAVYKDLNREVRSERKEEKKAYGV